MESPASLSSVNSPTLDAAASTAPADTSPLALAATSRDALDTHIAERLEAGEIHQFLDETDDAVTLAERSPVFSEELAPLLGEIRDALDALPSWQMSRVESEAVGRTVERIDTYLANVGGSAGPDGPDAPVFTGKVPGGGLEAHERAGGHTLERHVGKSEEWLINRVNRDKISAASSFRDVNEAEHFLSQAIAEHQAEIDAWVAGKGGNRLVFNTQFDASTGISVKRGDNEAKDVFSVLLVLDRSNQLDTGYKIVTGYPTTP